MWLFVIPLPEFDLFGKRIEYLVNSYDGGCLNFRSQQYFSHLARSHLEAISRLRAVSPELSLGPYRDGVSIAAYAFPPCLGRPLSLYGRPVEPGSAPRRTRPG